MSKVISKDLLFYVIIKNKLIEVMSLERYLMVAQDGEHEIIVDKSRFICQCQTSLYGSRGDGIY